MDAMKIPSGDYRTGKRSGHGQGMSREAVTCDTIKNIVRTAAEIGLKEDGTGESPFLQERVHPLFMPGKTQILIFSQLTILYKEWQKKVPGYRNSCRRWPKP
jgi:hypothetical protein